MQRTRRVRDDALKNVRVGPMSSGAMWAKVKRLVMDDKGATAVEYGLIVAAIAGLLVAVIFVTGKKLNNTFNNVQSRL